MYTAISGGYDVLKAPPAAPADTRFVAFLDQPQDPMGWEFREIHAAFKDPLRNAKIHKALPHLYFPDVEASLWVDGSFPFRSALRFERMLRVFFLSRADIVTFRHRVRKCPFEEAKVCAERRLDDPELIRAQMDRYRREAYPQNAGLGEVGILFRRHNERVERFNEIWWAEICRGSRRDQLSFNYAVRKSGATLRCLPPSFRTRFFGKLEHARPRPHWSGVPDPETISSSEAADH